MSNYNVLLAVDSFKGSASSLEVERYIEEGIRRVNKEVQINKVPIADGGEGTVEALVKGLDGRMKEVEVTGPYYEKTRARFGIIHENVAVIEMAEASGLHLVEEKGGDPINATTFGTGELVLAALDAGADKIYIGLGGSATNDGGAGMAQALGVSLKDASGEEISFGADALQHLETIDTSNMDERVKKTAITILSDVTNPLYGKKGASVVYGPQKGASEEEVIVLDKQLRHFAEKVREQLDVDLADEEGAGAAGGLGFGLMAFCGAQIRRGIEEVLDLLQIDEQLQDADVVITGEGKMDGQSIQGKAPIGVAKRAKKYGVPVIAVVGSAAEDLTSIYENGIDLVIGLVNKPMSLEDAMAQTEVLAANAGETAFRAFLLHERIID